MVDNVKEQIRKMLTEEFLTPKQIALKRKTSVQAVYKIIRKLKEKGELQGSMNTPYHSPNPPTNIKPSIRLHGQQFSITLTAPSTHTGLTFLLSGVKVKVLNRVILIWSKAVEFQGDTTEHALKQSMGFWHTFFLRLEDRLKIYFYSQNKGSIKLVASHYEEQDSETGKYMDKKGERLQIRSTKDGMVWLTTDRSFKLENTEALHPKTSYEDSQLIFDNIFNSWRDKKAYTPEETTNAIGQLAAQFHFYQKNMETHVKAIQQLSYSVKRLTKVVEAKKACRDREQKDLGGWLG